MFEGGKVIDTPTKLVAALAVIRNPWFGRGYVEDLGPEIREHGPVLGKLLTTMLIDTVGDTPVIRLNRMDTHGATLFVKAESFNPGGSVKDLDTLRGSVPDGLREVMKVPGLGPKTVRRLWQEAEVESLDDLEAAIEDGRLEALPTPHKITLLDISRKSR
mgnify:CR=1 FL=1